MLQVQEYLRSGKGLEALNSEFGIKNVQHPSLPLVILNYDSLDSPKTHPIVRECRGLVLNSEDWSLVAKGFSRFYNWGEVVDEAQFFNFNNFTVQSKEDGSFVLIYYFRGQWMANTRGSFGNGIINDSGVIWQQGFCDAMGIFNLDGLDIFLNRNYTYVCEYCSLYNKIVRVYPTPRMYLLSIFQGERELTIDEVDHLYERDFYYCFFQRPTLYKFTSAKEIEEWLVANSEKDPTFEGVVTRDNENRRWKLKSLTYWGLHHLRGEGNNLFSAKYILPYVLNGDDEVLTYFPEVQKRYEEVQIKVEFAYNKLVNTWKYSQGIESQKDFALAIKGKTEFGSMLFNLRKKHGINIPYGELKFMWHNSYQIIYNTLFK